MIKFIKNTHSELVRLIFNVSVKNKDFCIFSNDCWGGQLYRRMKIPYNTPFVGVGLMAPCYMKILRNPKKYFDAEMEFVKVSDYPLMNEELARRGGYPVGKILDIELHFMHSKSEEECREGWNRRKLRINWDNILVKFTMDKDYATEEYLKEFESLPYSKKVCFSKLEYPQFETCIRVDKHIDNGFLLFRSSIKHFDLIAWLNSGRLHYKGLSKLRGLLLFFILQR